MVIIGSAGYMIYNAKSLETRLLSKISKSYFESIVGTNKKDECFDIKLAYKKDIKWFCEFGFTKDKPDFFVFGDSHALSLIPALVKFAETDNKSIIFTGTSGCPPLLGIQSMRGDDGIEQFNCQKLNQRIFEYIKKEKIKSVILIARWSYYYGGKTKPEELNLVSMDLSKSLTNDFSKKSFEYGIKTTIETYANIGVTVYLIMDNPQQTLDPRDILKKSRMPSDILLNKFSVSLIEHMEDQASVNKILNAENSEFLHILNTDKILCPNDICTLVREGRFLYLDDDHLSIDGAMLIQPHLQKFLQ